jgi:hypothetical protein
MRKGDETVSELTEKSHFWGTRKARTREQKRKSKLFMGPEKKM